MSAPTSGYDLRPSALSTDEMELASPWLAIPDPLPRDGANYEPFTIEHWLYLRGNESNAGLLASREPGSSWSGSGVNLYIRTETGAGYAFTVSGDHLRIGTPPVETWTHVAWVFTGSEIQVWEDAALVGSFSISPLPAVNDYWHAQFTSSTDVFPIDGEIARLRFWGAALTSGEIADARNHVTPGNTNDLLAQYAMNAGTADPYESPVVGSAYGLLLNHGPYKTDHLLLNVDALSTVSPPNLTRRFDGDAIGVLPDDWVPVWRAGLDAEVVEIDDLAGYRRALEVTAVAGNRCGLRWTVPMDADHGECLMLQRTTRDTDTDAINFVGAFIGGAGTDEGDISATLGISRQARRTQFAQYDDGGFSSDGAADSRLEFDFRAWHWLRVRYARDGTLALRYWYVGWREPEEWFLDTTVSALPAGWIGWSCSHNVGHQLAEFRFAPAPDTLDRTEPQSEGLAGTVLDIFGNPVEAREVRIYQRLGGAHVDTVLTDANGQWEWRRGQSGIEYYVLAIDPSAAAEDFAPMAANRLKPTALDND